MHLEYGRYFCSTFLPRRRIRMLTRVASASSLPLANKPGQISSILLRAFGFTVTTSRNSYQVKTRSEAHVPDSYIVPNQTVTHCTVPLISTPVSWLLSRGYNRVQVPSGLLVECIQESFFGTTSTLATVSSIRRTPPLSPTPTLAALHCRSSPDFKFRVVF